MSNYFNQLTFIQKLKHLKKCHFIQHEEFSEKNQLLLHKKIVIIGCGSQGLNQGLNMRDSGLNITYALTKNSIINKTKSWINATKNNFSVGTYEETIPQADMIINLTPDKQHASVLKKIEPLMKRKATLGYSHGFHIVEIGKSIRSDITVIMVAPKCPGTEVREEYKKGFGVPTLVATHTENDPYNMGISLAKAWAFSLGSHHAGVLHSSFIAEVKSDLMGEQTILCGMLQTGSIICFEYMIKNGINAKYATQLIQYGWEVITDALKQGGISLMMDRLSNTAKLRAFELSEHLKNILTPIFEKHMENILNGEFSKNMIEDWKNNDKKLLNWREKNSQILFEQTPNFKNDITEQTYFDHGILMIAIIKAGIELSFDTMTTAGISPEIAYYESLHELPLIANTIARKKLYEMNLVISDTAEYGNYLFSDTVIPILQNKIIPILKPGDLGTSIPTIVIHNTILREINEKIKNHKIEKIGIKLRKYMKKMTNISYIY